MTGFRRAVRIAGLGVAGAAVASSAQADGAYVNLGPAVSLVAGQAPAVGVGAEASFMYYPSGGDITDHVGWGAFAQAQLYLDDDEARYAGGIQFGNMFGGEVGWAYRDTSSTHTWTMGPHLAAFCSIGVMSFAIRGTVPLANGDTSRLPAEGWELAATWTIKVPIRIGNLQVPRFGPY